MELSNYHNQWMPSRIVLRLIYSVVLILISVVNISMHCIVQLGI